MAGGSGLTSQFSQLPASVTHPDASCPAAHEEQQINLCGFFFSFQYVCGCVPAPGFGPPGERRIKPQIAGWRGGGPPRADKGTCCRAHRDTALQGSRWLPPAHQRRMPGLGREGKPSLGSGVTAQLEPGPNLRAASSHSLSCWISGASPGFPHGLAPSEGRPVPSVPCSYGGAPRMPGFAVQFALPCVTPGPH